MPSPVAISAEQQSPDHVAIEIEAIGWVDCTDVESRFGSDDPSFRVAPEHGALRSVCREALIDALQGSI
jgi:hypothetical protein